MSDAAAENRRRYRAESIPPAQPAPTPEEQEAAREQSVLDGMAPNTRRQHMEIAARRRKAAESAADEHTER